MNKDEHYFINLNFPYSDTWDKDKNYMNITLQNVHYSIANSLRRSMMSMIKTVGFRSLPYNNTTINIEKNNTYLNNEIIKHRISMIPVYINDDIDIDDYEFIIDEENNTNVIKMLDSSYIKIHKISTNTYLSEKETRKILPPDPITNNFIPIVKLKPKYYTDLGTTELREVPKHINIPNITPISLKLCAKLVKSNAFENAHFSPVCTCSYGYTIDEDIIDEKESEYIKNTNSENINLGLSAIDEDILKRRFYNNEIYQYYRKDEHNEPISFDLTIESIGPIKPLHILHKGLTELINRVKIFIENIKTKNIDKVEIYPSKKIRNGFEIKYLDMDDTLGNMLQCYLVNKLCMYHLGNDRKVESITYNKIHPLENIVLFTIRNLKNNMDNTINDYIIPSCHDLINHLTELDEDLNNIYI